MQINKASLMKITKEAKDGTYTVNNILSVLKSYAEQGSGYADYWIEREKMTESVRRRITDLGIDIQQANGDSNSYTFIWDHDAYQEYLNNLTRVRRYSGSVSATSFTGGIEPIMFNPQSIIIDRDVDSSSVNSNISSHIDESIPF